MCRALPAGVNPAPTRKNLSCALRAGVDPAPKAGRSGWCGLLTLLLTAGLWAAPLDVVVLVDSSGSSARSDPQQLRQAASQALVELLSLAGEVRIGVLRFAGWLETEASGGLVHPLVQLPADARARAQVVDELCGAILANVASDGTASDFNAAFGPAFESLLQSRGPAPGRLWVVLLSDGRMDVVETDQVRPLYLERAGQRPQRDSLRKAALEVFRTEVLPRLAELDVELSALQLGDGPSPAFDALQTELGAHVVRAAPRELLGSLLRELPPAAAAQLGLTASQSRFALPAGASVQQAFSLPPGCASAQLCLFAPSALYSMQLSGPDGAVLPLQTRGDGRPYRLLQLHAPAAGEYLLSIQNEAAGKLDFDAWVGFQPALEAWLPERVELAAGRASLLQCRFRAAGKALAEGAMPPEGQLVWSLSGSASLSGRQNLDGALLELPPLAPGRYTIELGLEAFADEAGGYRYQAPRNRQELIARKQRLFVEADSLAFAGGRARVRAHFSAEAGPPSDTLMLRLIAPEDAAFALHWVPGVGYEAWLPLQTAGRYLLRAPEQASFALDPPELEIVARARVLSVRDAWSGAEAADPLQLERVSSRRAEVSLTPHLSTAPGEQPQLEMLLQPSRTLQADVVFSFEGKPLEPGTWQPVAVGVPQELALQADDWPGLPEPLARLELRATFGGQELLWSRRLTVPAAGTAERLLALWPYWLPALLLLVLILLFWFGRPFWQEQQLKLKGAAVGAEKTQLQVWRTGRARALGTGELPGTLQFRLRGLRYFHPRCFVGPAKPGVLLKVDGEKVYKETNLFHGSEIELQAFDAQDMPQTVHYRYFLHPPTPQEEERDLIEEEESGGDFFVITDEWEP